MASIASRIVAPARIVSRSIWVICMTASPYAPTAIHDDVLSCHVAGCIGTEELHRGAVLVTRGHPAERNQLREARHEGVRLIDPHAARRQGVDTHAAIGPVGREVSRQPNQRRL